ncbi:hypothetical protein BC830DRAFT_1171945 [Chytriomyces sp. MP71]|nr:hypothetical protein BC830DRAFT_1171945 [Chytriomyces sp. MP71]
MNDLPIDILLQLLSREHPASVFRLRRLCKAVLIVLESSAFARLSLQWHSIDHLDPRLWINAPSAFQGIYAQRCSATTTTLTLAFQHSLSIPLSVSLFSNLSRFELFNSHLSRALPIELFHLASLKTWCLWGTRLPADHDSELSVIPYHIGRFTSLLHLEMKDCHLSLNFPKSLESLTKLSNLNVSRNNLCGPIPAPTFAPLEHLQNLNLSSNRFTGIIPNILSRFISLQVLDLSRNSFTCKIPDMSLLVNLRHLDLSYNALHGQIPMTLCGCALLEVLYLNDNALEGALPEEVGQLESLERLRFAGNAGMEGVEVPVGVCLLDALVECDVEAVVLVLPENAWEE